MQRVRGAGSPIVLLKIKHYSKSIQAKEAPEVLKNLRLGCLNVRSCNNLDKRERLRDERKLNVLVLSETKLKGRGEFRWEKVRGIKRWRER